jgi:hypothetical protein
LIVATSYEGRNWIGWRLDLGAHPSLPGSQRNPNHWFNTSAFVTPPVFYDAQGAYSIPGNEGRNVIAGRAWRVGTRAWSATSARPSA